MGQVFSRNDTNTADSLVVNLLRTSTVKKSKRSKLEKLKRKYAKRFHQGSSAVASKRKHDTSISLLADISEIKMAEDTTSMMSMMKSIQAPSIFIDQSCIYNGSFWEVVGEDADNFLFEQVPPAKQQTKQQKKGFDLLEYFSSSGISNDKQKTMTVKPANARETSATTLTRFASFHNNVRAKRHSSTLKVRKPLFELVQIKVLLDRGAADFGEMTEVNVTIASQEVTIDTLLFDVRTRLAKSMLPVCMHKNGIWCLKYPHSADGQWTSIDRHEKAYALAQTMKQTSFEVVLLLTMEEIH